MRVTYLLTYNNQTGDINPHDSSYGHMRPSTYSFGILKELRYTLLIMQKKF
jgi:hypothetical protein